MLKGSTERAMRKAVFEFVIRTFNESPEKITPFCYDAFEIDEMMFLSNRDMPVCMMSPANVEFTWLEYLVAGVGVTIVLFG